VTDISVFHISTSTDIYMLQSHIITKHNDQSQINRLQGELLCYHS
jgi:hypothetical protein